MLRTRYYVKQMKSIPFFNPSSVIYMRAQVISSTIANICWLMQIFKCQFCGFQMHLESNMVYNLKTKSDFWSKCPHYIMDYMINLGPMFFLVSLVWNFAYIDYSLCQIWSVYMEYLQCCDRSKKCLFLVVQQAEMLLFGEYSHWTSCMYPVVNSIQNRIIHIIYVVLNLAKMT